MLRSVTFSRFFSVDRLIRDPVAEFGRLGRILPVAGHVVYAGIAGWGTATWIW
jgi:hypothetical protein